MAYDIKVNIKGAKDTIAYLAKYVFDQTYIADTCKLVKNGAMTFKGKTALDKGVYILVNQDKAPFFEFIINESQKFTINANVADIVVSLSVIDSKENEKFFSYLKNNVEKNNEFNAARLKTKGKSSEDSTKFMHEKIAQLDADVKKFESDFMQDVKGSFIYDIFNLKTEKTSTLIPTASNGRPDSLYQYYYYKNHFFDGINFKDERIARTPYFDDRVKKYFDNLLVNNPDTVIHEVDKALSACDQNSLVYNALISYFTYKYEQSKIVGFDKVFLHIVDNYIISGKTKGMYSEETIKVLKERSAIMNPLLEGKKVNELYMIDTVYARQVRKMGFDTTSSAKSITDLYYKNQDKLAPMFRTLYQVNAKYTILLFWAADCGHCQKEVPKLHENLKNLKGKIDVKVFAVQTKDDLFEAWRKFLIENKITDFINVFDPVHINDVKTKFDVNSTPLIYVLDKDKKIIAKKIASEYVGDLLKALDKQEKKP
ncbi:thioredoxin-like domain-containing protein [Aurantibacillus circumpalustris]|uniref:thioredoxin-like domain-containing protein n=1 Tax=Aurantibacillus circumpalustris TaxID=3036359 RepID=UPI00295AAE2B|nr:thioredoxin-like domain-containing protein [Aurantibacillus circumpalustris]